ncbi:MAG: recombinase RecA [Candidatus Sulfotelmatobacter sp.]
MRSATQIRNQIETALAERIPAALTPSPRIPRAIAATGLQSIDALLEGGLPVAAITEVVGPECSGRTSLALSFLAGMTQTNKVCAWIDVSDGLDPESAAANGVELSRLLWVRCGIPDAPRIVPVSRPTFVIPEKYFAPPPIKKGLHGGGFGSHPRDEIKGISNAVSGLFRTEATIPHCVELQRKPLVERASKKNPPVIRQRKSASPSGKPWSRIGQALRVADLLLQGGGFSAIVLDMCSIAPEDALRIPLATWFRYRAAAERNLTSILLLTQHSCAKSGAELLLRLEPGGVHHEGNAVLSNMEHRLKIERRRLLPIGTNITPLRKPPQTANNTSWCSQTAWTGPR